MHQTKQQYSAVAEHQVGIKKCYVGEKGLHFWNIGGSVGVSSDQDMTQERKRVRS